MSEATYTFGFGWTVPQPAIAPRANRYAMRDIAIEVAARYGLPLGELTGPARHKSVCAARFEAMHLIYQERWPNGRRVYSLPQIGKFFNRDHTTVLNALKRYRERSGTLKYCKPAPGAPTGIPQIIQQGCGSYRSTSAQITA